ncbi:AI-2E family transporter [Rugosimonospora africana]|uniref:AI-2E family transporter n=1 Tax=Rugosimonospora africana TaxID=556532 RepID=A0A8J3R1Q4_9ACTN|nr:AI-2E family transporter [Rugosimonospora africana]GIH20611.1 AI-2E family transporter [Rugosimonospora africana]
MATEKDLARSVEEEEEAAPPEPVSPRTVFRWAVAASLGVVAVYLAYRVVNAVRDVLVEILIAAFIAISLDPPVRWLIRHGIKRSRAVAIVLVLVLIVAAGLLMLFIPPLIQQGGKLTSSFPDYLNHLRSSSPGLRKLENRFHLQGTIDDLTRTLPARLGRQALGFTQKFLGAVVSALLILVLTIYFMADLPRLRRSLVRLFSRRYRRPVNDAVNVVIDKVGSYMIGNLIISGIAGVTSLAALEALRIPFALPLAVFVAVTDLIPLIGAALGALVAVIVALATTDLWPHAILLGLFFLLYQQLENYLVAPRVLRNTVAIPALAVLLAALLGGTVLGLVGALIAIPLAAAVKVIMTPVLRARDAEQAGATLDADGPQR